MFDLNQQIDLWKRALRANATCSKDELEELESHLREQIEAMIAAGLSQEEAFAKSISRLGDPHAVCREFAKNEFKGDWLAIRAGNAMVALVGLAAVVLGIAVGIEKQDELLAAHTGSILFAYLVPLLLAVVGSYAILRTALVKSSQPLFRDRFAAQCKILLGATALATATGAILGGFWTERHWGRFWGWDLKEIGAFSVVLCALVLLVLVTRDKPASVRLGQASLILSIVTFLAWFGPPVYMHELGVTAVAFLIVALVAQLSMLGVSLLLPGRELAQE
jgi:Cytochrome C assembly protein